METQKYYSQIYQKKITSTEELKQLYDNRQTIEKTYDRLKNRFKNTNNIK